MGYKLSSSKLNLLQDCPRCFWLAMIKNFKRPASPMSSVPIKMDSIIKNYFNKYRELGQLPPIIQGMIPGKLAINMPKTLTYEESNGITAWGRPDDYVQMEDDSIVVIDHKTGSKAPTAAHSSYQLQMNMYSYLLNKLKYKTKNKAYLIYYCPVDSNLHDGMVIKLQCSRSNYKF